MDQFSIRPGEQFPWTIQQAAWHAPVMIVLIGPDWVARHKQPGEDFSRRQIDGEWDYVRREVVAALDTGTVVIPVVLPGGALPATLMLGTEMLALGDSRAVDLTRRHWKADIDALISAIRSSIQ
jgi:hypothetical protein